MLDLALKSITNQLNRYMHQHFDLDEDAVMLTSPFDSEGNASTQVSNKLVVFLTNINKDTTFNNLPSSGSSTTTSFTSPRPLSLNLYVLVAASFDTARYQESLKYLSHAMSCFQQQPIIDRHNSPELADSIERLILDIENVDINDLSNLWGILGGQYIPSILYRVRMVVFTSDAIDSRVISVNNSATTTAGI